MVAIQGPTGQAGSGRKIVGPEVRTASRQSAAARAGQSAAVAAHPGTPLQNRYGDADLDVFDLEERRRFGHGDPRPDAQPPLGRLQVGAASDGKPRPEATIARGEVLERSAC